MNETSMIDLGNQLKSLQGVAGNIAKVNAMISGEQEYDLAFMNEMMNLYPEIGECHRCERSSFRSYYESNYGCR